MSQSRKPGNTAIIRRMSMETYMVRIYTGPLSQECEYTCVEAEKVTPAEEVVRVAVAKLKLHNPDDFELAEVLSSGGQLCKERRLEAMENPVRIQLLWPKNVINSDNDRLHGLLTGYRFYIRKKDLDNTARTSSWMEYVDPNPVDNFLTSFLKQPTSNKEYPDLCNLPDLNEHTLLKNIKSRFLNSNIYTYVGSILIAVNPFKFFPIYNPKYVKMYQNKRLGDLPPHIFAIADSSFHTMLRTKRNQCIVISGESGSGKTESTNLLLHHLTALSQKGLHGSGVEQTILGAGPVLEAFGNAKTVHNNNSSRFGKFIQVNYKENGMVHGAIVEKYLLEKSRIVCQAKAERNYHVFYYLLASTDELERKKLFLGKPEDYFYLNQSDCFSVEEVDEVNEFARLRQSMEMVGFSTVTQKRIFGVLSAVLHLGNVEFKKKGDQHHDESVCMKDEETIKIISSLLKVKEKTLVEALTQKKATAGGETVVMNYRMEDAVATRDAMAKCLYGALFDWIVLKVNQALLAKRHNSEHQEDAENTTPYCRHTGNSIGVLDIFGFEDFQRNSFEQFCINYANEHLQYYFNQHIFKFEQEEYKKEGIQWKNIEFIDNTGCLELFSRKPNGLFSLLDEECNFPGATNETLLSKFHHHHSRGNVYYEAPQKREMAFAVLHYAGRVKYNVLDFREKNSDLIRTDIVGNLKSSSLSFVRELMGVDPVAVLRWTIVKTLIKSIFAFIRAGEKYRKRGGPDQTVVHKRKQSSDRLQIPDLNSDSFLRRRKSPEPRSPKRTNFPKLHDPACTTNVDSGCYDDDDDDDVFVRRRHSDLLRSPVDPYLSEDEAKVMWKATKVMMKNKSFRPKSRPHTMFRDIKTLKAIAGRTMFGGGKMASKKQQPPSVSAQFQWSLSRLMATLNQANPFFIRCIKSNADKAPCEFDDLLVLRQLRYTGMLATVRIRQSGYNYRLTFEEFIQLYKILLPKGLLSSKEDVHSFLEDMSLNVENYQIGKTKVFLRENEKMLLDEALHCAIMKRVIAIQRWTKTKLERKNFLQLREATVTMQKHIRRFLAQVHLHQSLAAIYFIQKWFRGVRVRRKYHFMRRQVIKIQSHYRAYKCRIHYVKLKEERRLELEERRRKEAEKQAEDLHSSTSDEGVLIRGPSQEELDREFPGVQRRDSEESSGILDDSESDTLSVDIRSRDGSIYTPPMSPEPMGPHIIVHGTKRPQDDYLQHSKQSSRVSDIAKAFQSSPDDPDGGTIFVRRGSQRKRPPKIAAPLAKQESFSDLDLESSPGDVSPGFVLSPQTKREIEESLKKNKEKHEAGLAAAHDEHHQSRSPFRKIMKFTGGTRRKKDSTAEESDEEEHDRHRRPQNLGVAVLPPLTTGTPKSPTSSDKFNLEDQEAGKIDKKRRGGTQKRRREERKPSPPPGNQFNVAKTSQWQYPDDWVIKEIYELQLLDEFINRKAFDLNKDSGKRDTIFDVVFKKALKEFHREMTSTISVEMQKGGSCNIKYRDILLNFEVTLDAIVKEEKTNASFPVTMGINAFRSYLDEYRNNVQKNQTKKVKKRGRNQQRDKHKKDVLEYLGHKFVQVQFGIPTFCELCSNIIWIMEKGHVCQVCRYTCHKKCVHKSTSPCKGAQDSQQTSPSPKPSDQPPPAPATMFGGPYVQNVILKLNRLAKDTPGKKVFGAPLQSLMKENQKVPEFMDRLIQAIELHGLHTVGIYRKSGAKPKIQQLKAAIDQGTIDFNVEVFTIHTLTATLKSFFRELPEPLLTFDLYDEFLRASEIKDDKEAVQSIFSALDKMPKINHDVFERLVFHLARVAKHEASNKMSVNGLSIIWAPCLLRTSKNLQAQESLKQVNQQTMVIDRIIKEQLDKLKTTLKDINTLESAEVTAEERLSIVRASMRTTKEKTKTKAIKESSVSEQEESESMDDVEVEERALSSHIQSIRKEKDDLTSTLPLLECRHSSDDEVLSVDDMDSTYDTADDMDEHEEYALTFDLPATPPTELQHLTKRRANVPERKPPERYRFCLEQKKNVANDSGTDDLSDKVDNAQCYENPRCDKIDRAQFYENPRPLSFPGTSKKKQFVQGKQHSFESQGKELLTESSVEGEENTQRLPSYDPTFYIVPDLNNEEDEIMV